MADEKKSTETPPAAPPPPAPKPSPPKAKGATYSVHVQGLLDSPRNRRYRIGTYPEDAFLRRMAESGAKRAGTVMVTKD